MLIQIGESAGMARAGKKAGLIGVNIEIQRLFGGHRLR